MRTDENRQWKASLDSSFGRCPPRSDRVRVLDSRFKYQKPRHLAIKFCVRFSVNLYVEPGDRFKIRLPGVIYWILISIENF